MEDLLYHDTLDIEYHEVNNFNLHTIMNELSKKELMMISKNFKINHVSHKKRGELQSIIESDLNIYLKKVLYFMNDHHLEVLNHFLTEEFIEVNEKDTLDLPLRFFMEYGFIFPVNYQGVTGMVLPKEVKRRIISLLTPEVMDIFDRNNRIIAIANHYVQLYGLLEYQTLNYFYQQKFPNDHYVYDLKEIIELESRFTQTILCEEEYFYTASLAPSLFHFIDKRKRVASLDYYPFTHDTTSVIDLQDKAIIQKLMKPIRKLDANEQNNILLLTIDYMNRGYSFDYLEENLRNHMTKKMHLRYIKQLTKVENDLRLWIHKGHRTIDFM